MTATEIKDLVMQGIAAVGGTGAIVTFVCMIWRTVMSGRSNKLIKANTLATNGLFEQMKDWFQNNVVGKIRVNVSAQLNALSAEIRAQYLEKEEQLNTQMAIQNKLLFEMADLMLTSPKVSKDEKNRVEDIMGQLKALTSEKYLDPKSVVDIELAEEPEVVLPLPGESAPIASTNAVDMIQV